jgi:hypothetical protein
MKVDKCAPLARKWHCLGLHCKSLQFMYCAAHHLCYRRHTPAKKNRIHIPLTWHALCTHITMFVNKIFEPFKISSSQLINSDDIIKHCTHIYFPLMRSESECVIVRLRANFPLSAAAKLDARRNLTSYTTNKQGIHLDKVCRVFAFKRAPA